MTVGQLLLLTVLLTGQTPTRHEMESPQGWPEPTHVTATHVCEAPQVNPATHSLPFAQLAPAAAAGWHVDPPPAVKGQVSGAWHSSLNSQGAPAAPGAAHTPLGLQMRPDPHT
jgi:hypothetical protein